MKLAYIVLVCMLLLDGCEHKLKTYTSTTSSSHQETFQEKLQKRLVKDLNELKIPGIEVSVVVDGKEGDFAIGTIDYKRMSQITNDHILRVGSITKIYTSTIIMRLVEEGSMVFQNFTDEDIPEQTGYGLGLRRLVIKCPL